MRQFRFAVFILFGLTAAAPAVRATGSFECAIDDNVLSFTTGSVYSDGLGQVFTGLKAEARIQAPDVADDLRKLDLAKSLVHHWIGSGDLRLRFYVERDAGKPHASVELIVTATGEPDGGDMSGSYQLIIDGAEPLTGDATCSAG